MLGAWGAREINLRRTLHGLTYSPITPSSQPHWASPNITLGLTSCCFNSSKLHVILSSQLTQGWVPELHAVFSQRGLLGAISPLTDTKGLWYSSRKPALIRITFNSGWIGDQDWSSWFSRQEHPDILVQWYHLMVHLSQYLSRRHCTLCSHLFLCLPSLILFYL